MSMTTEIKDFSIRASKVNFSSHIELLGMTRTHIAEPLTMVPHDQSMIPQPTCVMTIHQAQVLIDDLWQAGLRPSEGTGSAGQLAATQKHLADMRTIAFKQLKIDGQ